MCFQQTKHNFKNQQIPQNSLEFADFLKLYVPYLPVGDFCAADADADTDADDSPLMLYA